MGELCFITDHPRYVPKRVLSFAFYLLDKRLNNMAVNIYRYLLSKCNQLNGKLYVRFGAVDELRDDYQRFQATETDQPMPAQAEVATGVTLLRKFQYIKFIYDADLQQKVILLTKYVGDLA